MPPAPLRAMTATGTYDLPTRVRLGAAAESGPELLASLANDDSVLVRTAVALNRSAPHAINQALTADADERVRVVLAQKLGAALPSLSTTEHAELAEEAWETLALLARDTAEQVRAVVADTLKDFPLVPRALLMGLARDPSFAVADPILRLSPALAEADLLELIRERPAPHTVACIAGRATLSARLSEAIASSPEEGAITTLLANPSAMLSESALDALVARAGSRPAWHKPLVRRPALSARHARLLAEFVSEQLLRELAARPDLDGTALEAVRARLKARSGAESPRAHAGGTGMAGGAPDTPGWAGEPALVTAIAQGNLRQVERILAHAAGLTLNAIRRAARTRNARAAIALLWKGGFSMRPAAAIQALLFSLPPGTQLQAGPRGAFPLTEREMQATIGLMEEPD